MTVRCITILFEGEKNAWLVNSVEFKLNLNTRKELCYEQGTSKR